MTLTKVIIAFSILIVLGCSIIGYGLYQKHQRSLQEDKVLAQVNDILSQTPQTFARMSPAQRGDVLSHARRAQLDLGSLRDAPHEKVTELKNRIGDLSRIHQTLESAGKSLRELKVQLTYTFPAEPKQQLSATDSQRLADAVACAQSVTAGTVQMRGGGSVTVAEAFRDETDELRKLASSVNQQIQSRSQAFDTFDKKIQDFVGGPSLPETKAIAAAQTQVTEWQGYAAADTQKYAQLEALNKKLAEKKQSADAVSDALSKLQGLIEGVETAPDITKASAVDTLKRELPPYESLADQTKSRELQAKVARARNVLASDLGAAKKAKERAALVDRLVKTLLEASDSSNDYYRRSRLSKAADDIRKLKATDSDYGRFFEAMAKTMAPDASSGPQAQRESIIKLIGSLSQTTNSFSKSRIGQQALDQIKAYRSVDSTLAAFFEEVLQERLGGTARTPISGPPIPGSTSPASLDPSVDLSQLSTSLRSLEIASESMERLLAYMARPTSTPSPSAFSTAGRRLVSAINTHVFSAKKLLAAYSKLPSAKRGNASLYSLSTSISELESAGSSLTSYVNSSSGRFGGSSSRISSSAMRYADEAVKAAKSHIKLVNTLQGKQKGTK